MKNVKHFILGFIAATILLTCVIRVSADSLIKDISAQVAYELKIMLNGKEFTPQETDGTVLRPIVYNGRTYLPVRALCDAVGVKVQWEGSTNTIWLSTVSEKDNVSNNGEEKVVATINSDSKITLGEVNLYLRQMEAYYEGNFGPNVWDQPVGEEGKTVTNLVKENALSATENANIIALLAKEEGIKISDEEAKKTDELAQEFIGQLDKEIAEKDGITLDVVKKILGNQALAQAFYEKEMADYTIDEDELNILLEKSAEYKAYKENGYTYYAKQVRARHILFKTVDDGLQPLTEDKLAEVKAKAEEVLTKARAGEDFAKLAKEYTDDHGSKETGGEYTFKRGVMVAEFENAAFSMKPGEISELVETVYGYHIIKLEEIIEPNEEQIKVLKEKEESIVNSATEQLKQQVFDKKFEEWKANYKVEVNNEVWDAVEVRQSRNAVVEDTK